MGKPYRNGNLKKKDQDQRKRTTTRKRQPIQLNSHNRLHFIRGTYGSPNTPPLSMPLSHTKLHFVIKPLSNFDLMKWIKRLGIKHFRGIYSRNGLPKKIKKE